MIGRGCHFWRRRALLVCACCVLPGLLPALAFSRPVVAITRPADQAVLYGDTTVEVAFRSDSMRPIVRLDLLLDGRDIQSDPLPTPLLEGQRTLLLPSAALAPGTHRLTVRALDTLGDVGTVEVNISSPGGAAGGVDVIPPAVSIYYPAQGATVSGFVTVRAEVNDSSPIRVVMFYVDGKLHTVRMNAPPFTAEWDTRRFQDGPHVLEARAKDSADNEGNAAPVTVIVQNHAAAPTPAPVPTPVTVPGPATIPTPGVSGPTASGSPAVVIPVVVAPPTISGGTGEPAVVIPGPVPVTPSPVVAMPPVETGTGPGPMVAATGPIGAPGGVPAPVTPVPGTPSTELQVPVVEAPTLASADTALAPPPGASDEPKLASAGPMLPAPTATLARPDTTVAEPQTATPEGTPMLPTAQPSGDPLTAPAGELPVPAPIPLMTPGLGVLSEPPAPEPEPVAAPTETTVPATGAAPTETPAPATSTTPVEGTAPAAVTAPVESPAPVETPAATSTPAVAPPVEAVATPPVSPEQLATAPMGTTEAAPEPRVLVPGLVKPTVDLYKEGPQAAVPDLSLGAAGSSEAPAYVPVSVGNPVETPTKPVEEPAATGIATPVTPVAVVPEASASEGNTTEFRRINGGPGAPVASAAPEGTAAIARSPRTHRLTAADGRALAKATMTYNGRALPVEARPEVRQGVLMVSLKHIIEAADGALYWFASEKIARAVTEKTDLSVRLGSARGAVNGKSLELAAAPVLKDGRILVPLEFVCAALGMTVEFDPDAERVLATGPSKTQ